MRSLIVLVLVLLSGCESLRHAPYALQTPEDPEPVFFVKAGQCRALEDVNRNVLAPVTPARKSLRFWL